MFWLFSNVQKCRRNVQNLRLRQPFSHIVFSSDTPRFGPEKPKPLTTYFLLQKFFVSRGNCAKLAGKLLEKIVRKIKTARGEVKVLSRPNLWERFPVCGFPHKSGYVNRDDKVIFLGLKGTSGFSDTILLAATLLSISVSSGLRFINFR